MNEIIQYLPFSALLFHLVIPPGSSMVSQKAGFLSFFRGWIIFHCVYVCGCVFHIFFIHSSVNRHLCCFHILAVVSNASLFFSFWRCRCPWFWVSTFLMTLEPHRDQWNPGPLQKPQLTRAVFLSIPDFMLSPTPSPFLPFAQPSPLPGKRCLVPTSITLLRGLSRHPDTFLFFPALSLPLPGHWGHPEPGCEKGHQKLVGSGSPVIMLDLVPGKRLAHPFSGVGCLILHPSSLTVRFWPRVPTLTGSFCPGRVCCCLDPGCTSTFQVVSFTEIKWVPGWGQGATSTCLFKNFYFPGLSKHSKHSLA